MKKRILTHNIPIYTQTDTVQFIQKDILARMGTFDTVNYVYFLTSEKKLAGVLSLKQVFALTTHDEIIKHMKKDLVIGTITDNPEQIAHLALQEKLKSIPILSKNGTFLGILPGKKISEIIHKEATEDFLHLSGIIPEDNHSKLSLFKQFWNRLPWIVIGLFGGLFAAIIMGQYEKVLEAQVMLVLFVPLLVYVANAVGVQTQTLYIRDLALSKKISFLKYLSMQLFISALIGIVCWIIILLITMSIWSETTIGFIVGFSAFGGIIAATFFAMLVPFLLTLFKKDPAIGSGPFTTIIQDILSIVIFFTIASLFIL
ncbi:MAG: magnesium transporter [Candidatus Woesearchaeota archaeon]